MANNPGPMELEDGKVYLRDTRNGRVYQYEDTLAQMGYMRRFVQGEDDMPQQQEATASGYNVSLTGLDRAAEWDRQAAMTPEQRKEASAKRNATAADTAAKANAAPAAPVTAAQPAKAPAPVPAPTPAASATVAPPAPPAPPAK